MTVDKAVADRIDMVRLIDPDFMRHLIDKIDTLPENEVHRIEQFLKNHFVPTPEFNQYLMLNKLNWKFVIELSKKLIEII
jgi:hypothetical protein